MQTQNNIPALRFPEFDGEWEKMRLGKLIKIKSGNSPSSYVLNEKGVYPFIKVEELNNCIKYQNLSRFYSDEGKNLVEINSVIFPKRGAAILNNKVRINDCPILMDSNMMAITPNRNKLNHEFLYYKIFKEELFKIADTSTIPQINNKHIEPYLLSIPTLPEQQKVASFLSAVDEKIQQLTRKAALLEQYKKGIIQQLFSGTLRFKDDDGKNFPEWEEKKLGEITSLIKDGTHATHKDVIDGKHYLLSAKNIRNGEICIDNDDRKISETEYKSIYKNYNLEINDILLTIVGTIGRLAKYNGQPNIVFQRSVAIFRFKNIISDFMLQLMNGEAFQKELDTRKVVSAQPGIYLGDLGKIIVRIPSIKEQQKIASFLSGIDNKIASVNTQLEKTQRFKKGLLQQMFA